MGRNHIIWQVFVSAEQLANHRMEYLIFIKRTAITVILFYAAFVRDSKNGFNSRCYPGDNGSASCRGHCGNCRIPNSFCTDFITDRFGQVFYEFTLAETFPIKIRERTFFLGEFNTGFIGGITEDLHDLIDGLQGIFTVIFDTHAHEHIT